MEYFDRYSDVGTIVHRTDARIKLILAIISISIISFSKTVYPLYIIMPVVFILILIAKVPLPFVLRRMARCLPFLIYMLFVPPALAIMLLLKSLSSIIILTLIIATTPFKDILSSMAFFRVPGIFIMMLSFFYRYMFLFGANVCKMRHAMVSRGFGQKRKCNLNLISTIVGCLFVRSYEQSERVYGAMLARCYDDKN